MHHDASVLLKPADGVFAGFTLSSAFQPVFSLTHGRLVGHEALLRAADAEGAPVPPNLVFDGLRNDEERATLDALSVRLHLRAYAASGKLDTAEWLLLNMHPASLLGTELGVANIESAIRDSGIRPSRVVIEVLESPIADNDQVLHALKNLRALGCLVAIDDFGAGHSNFERVFDLRPHIVKLDRRVLLRAKTDARARRILQRMVSLIQECGALVLMEGVETLSGAHITLNCDADLVQGYFFGRPQAQVLRAGVACRELEEAWDTFDTAHARMEDRWRETMHHHCDRLHAASLALAGSADFAQACSGFLGADEATMCYLLDEDGRQVGHVAFRDDAHRDQLGSVEQFEPLRDCAGARWSRRQYFRRAVSSPGAVQLTRPYMTLQGGWMCLTASIAFEVNGRLHVLCGDVRVVAPVEAA